MMHHDPIAAAASPGVGARAESLFRQDYQAILKRTDRLFAGLMVFQWLAAVFAAFVISPRAWEGAQSSTHIHVWAAIFLGGLIAAMPVVLALLRPGRTITRHVIAVGQMLTSALLIHLLGGRIETHFHVFGSLAFLAFYRDWRVMITATIVVALDHMLRGFFWPQSVYGVAGGAEWRWLEHAGWVAFEDAFLILACAQGIREMRAIALRQAQIETKNIELAETTRRAEAAAVAKGQFLANMSHEIRTPLNGVIGMTELLGRTRLEANQAKYVGLIRTSADALLSLINDILDFSKIDAGKLELAQADFDPGALVEEVGEHLAPRAASKGVELLCRVAPEARALVRGDRARLRQILLNLGANAVKFTDHGEVIIRLAPSPDTAGALRFSVSDTGIGIPPDRMDRLFKKFSQVDGSNTRKHGGTGLGLAISKQLAELMGGAIGVESQIGRGSTFWCDIPLARAAGPVPTATDAARLSGLRVLIVDDNSTNREILGEQCAGWHFEARDAEDAPAAIRAIAGAASEGRPFDLVILDMQMPGMTGVELARRLKADPATASIPLLILSSLDGYTESEADAALFAARLVKPCRSSDLFEAIVNAAAPNAPAPATVQAHAAGAPQPDVVRRRALLAEDHPVNQMVAVEILKAGGVDCVIASNGRRAVEAIRQGGFDVVLMDCQMPEMDGFEATRAIRRLEQSGPSGPGNPCPIPIIALTANAVKGDRERCEAAGMNGYVTKPIDPAELLGAVSRLSHAPATAAPAAGGAPDAAGGGAGGATPALAADDAPEPIVYTELLRRCMGNPEIAAAVIDALIQDVCGRLAALEKAAAEHDAAEMGRIAHALKGAAANASAQRLRELAAAVEHQAREAGQTAAQDALVQIRTEIDRCIQWARRMPPAAHAIPNATPAQGQERP